MVENNYKSLACAVIEQEIYDFLRKKHYYKNLSDEEAEQKLYNFCTTNVWFSYIDIDGEYLYAKILKMKQEGRKSIWLKN